MLMIHVHVIRVGCYSRARIHGTMDPVHYFDHGNVGGVFTAIDHG